MFWGEGEERKENIWKDYLIFPTLDTFLHAQEVRVHVLMYNLCMDAV